RQKQAGEQEAAEGTARAGEREARRIGQSEARQCREESELEAVPDRAEIIGAPEKLAEARQAEALGRSHAHRKEKHEGQGEEQEEHGEGGCCKSDGTAPLGG